MGVLDGRVAIVTGAARGLGAAQVRSLLAEGCAVLATDVDAADEAANPAHEALTSLRHDVASEEEWKSVIETVMERYGRLDILVNNAGIFHAAPFQETDLSLIEAHYRVNQVGTFLGMKFASSVMLPARRGSIINISSTGGIEGTSGAFAYSMTKWAIRGMTKCAARDFAGTGVRVNAVLPGPIQTRMLETNPPDRKEAMRHAIPLGRFGTADEVAAMVLFLAGDGSNFVTGADFVVDGGISV